MSPAAEGKAFLEAIWKVKFIISAQRPTLFLTKIYVGLFQNLLPSFIHKEGFSAFKANADFRAIPFN